MNTILVPIDYSNACLKALEVALTLAARIKAQVLLCHIYQQPVLVSGEEEDEADPEAFVMTESETQQEALDKLRTFAKLVKENSPDVVPVIFTVKAGSIVEELHKLIKASAVMMVVLGTRKQTSLLNRVFGSATEKLMKQAACPVLVVPERAQANPFGRIVYATALEPDEVNALQQLAQAKKLFNATLAVLYVEDKRYQEQINITVRKNNLLKYFGENEVVFSQVKSKDVAGGIEAYVQKFNADLVAFTVSHHSYWQDVFHSSVTSRLLHELDLPLLAFPGKYTPVSLPLAEENR